MAASKYLVGLPISKGLSTSVNLIKSTLVYGEFNFILSFVRTIHTKVKRWQKFESDPSTGGPTPFKHYRISSKLNCFKKIVIQFYNIDNHIIFLNLLRKLLRCKGTNQPTNQPTWFFCMVESKFWKNSGDKRFKDVHSFKELS